MLITAKWPEISIQQGCGSVLKTKFSAYKARPGKVLSVFRVVFFEWTTVGSGLFIMNNFQNTLNLNQVSFIENVLMKSRLFCSL